MTKLNMLIRKKDEKPTKSYLAYIRKSGKNAIQAEKYCSAILLYVYRNILSKFFLQRITPVLDKETKSTGDVVMVHIYFFFWCENQKISKIVQWI